jgi:hypothetical protein
MKQRRDQRHHRTLGAETHSRFHRAFVTDQQPRHRQGHVERVLAIVINRVDAMITGHAAGEELVEFFEREGDAIE